LFKIVDERIIDGFAVEGVGTTSQFLARGLAVLQSGFIGHYLFYLLIGLFAVLIVLVV
jgi:NADH-quinone oxidoreductase subunit L